MKKGLTMAKKMKGGPFVIFNIHSVAKLKKTERGPFGEKKFQESHNAGKKAEREDSSVSPGNV